MPTAMTHYKALHQIPELSGKEFKTSQYIYDKLESIGYMPYKICATSIIADLINDINLPWILLRADIDALPICENSGLPYSSQYANVMHACGHDAHTSMLLETAAILYKKKLPHNIRFLFQSAEETTNGAAEAIKCGVIPQNLIACFAMHVWPKIPLGQAITKRGVLMASSDVFRIKFSGKSAHCSQHNLGNDALLSAVDMAHKLPQIKQTVADDNTLLFCGSIHSGNSHNIVPDKAEIYGTLRTYSVQHQECIKHLLQQTADDISHYYGTTAKITFEGGCPPVYNSDKIVDILSRENFGVNDTATPTLAAEDFAIFGNYAPSAMIWLGIGDVPPLHNEKFFVPHEVLPTGVELWVKIANHDWKEELF